MDRILKSFKTGSWLLFLLVIVSAWHYAKVFEETLPVYIAIPLGLLVDLLLYFIVKYGMEHLTAGGITWSLIMTVISYIIYYTFYTIHQATLPLKVIFGIDSRVIYSAIFPLIIMACSWYFPKREAELNKTGDQAPADELNNITSLGDVFRLSRGAEKSAQDNADQRAESGAEMGAKTGADQGAEISAGQRADKPQTSAQKKRRNGRRPARRNGRKSARRIPIEIDWETCIRKDGERFIGTCPACAKIVRTDYLTEHSAKSGISGHLKTCEKLHQSAAEKGGKNE